MQCTRTYLKQYFGILCDPFGMYRYRVYLCTANAWKLILLLIFRILKWAIGVTYHQPSVQCNDKVTQNKHKNEHLNAFSDHKEMWYFIFQYSSSLCLNRSSSLHTHTYSHILTRTHTNTCCLFQVPVQHSWWWLILFWYDKQTNCSVPWAVCLSLETNSDV